MPKFAQPLLVLLLCVPSVLSADEPDARVQKILDAWKTQLAQLKSYHLKAKVFQYDAVFQVERRADLEAAWSPAGHRIVRWTPAEIPEGETSERTSDKGDRYQLESWREQEFWFSPAGKAEIHYVSDFGGRSPTANQNWGEWTESMQNWAKWTRSLSLSGGFLHPPVINEPIGRIEWTIVAEDDQTLTLHGLPQAEQKRRNFRELTVVVSEKDNSLRSIEVTDPAQTTQTLIRFVEVETGVPLPNKTAVFRIPDGGHRQVYHIPKMNGPESFGR